MNLALIFMINQEWLIYIYLYSIPLQLHKLKILKNMIKLYFFANFLCEFGCNFYHWTGIAHIYLSILQTFTMLEEFCRNCMHYFDFKLYKLLKKIFSLTRNVSYICLQCSKPILKTYTSISCVIFSLDKKTLPSL